MVSIGSLLGTQYVGLDFWESETTPWFLDAAPLLPTAASGDDGSNAEGKFGILYRA